MWKEGQIDLKSGRLEYGVKQFERRSKFGIGGGKISKLWMMLDGRMVASYDREWQIRLDDKLEDVKEIYRMLLARWN